MSSSRVDILLALRTKLEGNAEALAYLDKFEAAGKRSAQGVGAEWDQLTRKLARKFSLPDLTYDLLRGFGIGSAAAIVNRVIDATFGEAERRAKAAAEEVKRFNSEVEQMAARFDRIGDTKIGDWIETLAPADRIAAKKKQIEELTRTIEIAGKDRDEAAAKVARASTLAGVLGTMWRGSPEEGNYENFWQQFRNQAEVDRKNEEWTKRQVTIQSEANKAIADSEEKLIQLRRSVAQDEKQIEAERKKEAEAAAKEEEQLDEALTRSAIAAAEATEQAREKSAESGRKILADREQQAEKWRTLTDRQAKLNRDLAEIESLRGLPGGLSDAEADAAKARLIAEANDVVGQAIARAREEVEEFDHALALLDRNPALTDQEKHQERVRLLDAQTDAIKRLQEELQKFAGEHPGLETAALNAFLSSLGEKAAGNTGRRQPPSTLAQRDHQALRDLSDPSKHYQSAGDSVVGSMIQQASAIGTIGDQISRAMTQAGDSIRTNLAGAFHTVLTTGGSTRDKLGTIWNGFVGQFAQMGSQMLADWVFRHTVMAAIDAIWRKKALADTAATESAKTAILAGGEGARTGILAGAAATNTGIITTAAGTQAGATGVAAVFRSIMELGPIAGPLVFATAIAGMVSLVGSLAGFEKGGFPSGQNAVIRVNENGQEAVLNAGATSRLGAGAINALNAGLSPDDIFVPDIAGAVAGQIYAPPSGGGGGGGMGGGMSSSGRPLSIAILDPRRDRSILEQLERDPNAETFIVKTMIKNRHKLPGIKV